MSRKQDIDQFYKLIAKQSEVFPPVPLSQLSEVEQTLEQDYPAGVYFFFYPGELRSNGEPKIVRVGMAGSNHTLFEKLALHKTGNRNTSTFRDHIGNSLKQVHGWTGDVLERKISEYLGNARFMVIGVDDERDRKNIEKNAIALLSNYHTEPVDPASENWLGHHSSRARIMYSGLWNYQHVADQYNAGLLFRLLEEYIVKYSYK